MHQGEVDGVEHGLARSRLAQVPGRHRDPHDAGAPSGALGRQHQRAAPPRLGQETLADAEHPRPHGRPAGQIGDSAQTGK